MMPATQLLFIFGLFSPFLAGCQFLPMLQLFNQTYRGDVIGNGTGLGTDPMTGDFMVLITDLCPECQAGDVDLAEPYDGRWVVDIQAVQCPVRNATLEYKFQGSNPYYIKVQVRQIWMGLEPTADSFWIMTRGGQIWERPVETPFHIELVAINGERLIDAISTMGKSLQQEDLNISNLELAYLLYEDKRHNHAETQILDKSPKLSNIASGQYQMGEHLEIPGGASGRTATLSCKQLPGCTCDW